jgi:hypothetical protein
MERTRRKKTTLPLESDTDGVEVRVSPRAPRAKVATPPVTRAQNLATALLEGVIGQLADYIENSHAVEKLIRAQTTQVLRELAHDPQFTALIRSQAEQYVAELVSRPEILEPLVRDQFDRYLDHLLQDSTRLQMLAEKIKEERPPPPKPRKRKTRTKEIILE